MTQKALRYILTLCLFFTISLVFANKIPPRPKSADGQPGLPIDGGVSMLFISGIVFGVYSLIREK